MPPAGWTSATFPVPLPPRRDRTEGKCSHGISGLAGAYRHWRCRRDTGQRGGLDRHLQLAGHTVSAAKDKGVNGAEITDRLLNPADARSIGASTSPELLRELSDTDQRLPYRPASSRCPQTRETARTNPRNNLSSSRPDSDERRPAPSAHRTTSCKAFARS